MLFPIFGDYHTIINENAKKQLPAAMVGDTSQRSRKSYNSHVFEPDVLLVNKTWILEFQGVVLLSDEGKLFAL